MTPLAAIHDAVDLAGHAEGARVPHPSGQGYFIRTFGCQMNEHD